MFIAGIHPWDAWIPAFAGMTSLNIKVRFLYIFIQPSVKKIENTNREVIKRYSA
jgi:hypothetical protein